MGRVSIVDRLGVRKGAWTEEEDLLLRRCIEKYGEGKWCQVPLRAGLRRCRKSCRLRWLNYLRPNIKRGEFNEDEIDLIIRFHKLLGNRWSLIAGRILGRTANDIKNYWNSHLSKKLASMEKGESVTLANKVIKPQPRTFSRNSEWLKGLRYSVDPQPKEMVTKSTSTTESGPQEEAMLWWKSLLVEGGEEENGGSCSTIWAGEELVKTEGNEGTIRERVDSLVGVREWDNLLMDVDLWGLLDTDQAALS